MNALSISTGQSDWRRTRSPLPDGTGWGGALAGLVGGVAMVIVSLLLAGAYNYDIWFQLKSIASLVLGASAVAQVGFVAIPVLVGLALHLALSVALGALFSQIMGRFRLTSDFGVPAVIGQTYSLLIWLVAYFVVPVLLPQLMVVYAPSFIIQHVAYGTVTGLVYGLLRPRPYTTASA